MRALLSCLCVAAITGLTLLSLTGCTEHLIGMLNPKGIIAYQERKLFFDSLALMLIVVLPVIVMSLTFIYHYHASHHVADYRPNWSHSYFLEAIWWGIPCAIVVILAILAWKDTYELDPYRGITITQQPPLLVEAIALPWKWLFIYPEQQIATINYLEVPVGRQVIFSMTTDNVPMSAFFVPQLGSQIYAMAGMNTHLHLLADVIGTYDGMDTQFNGEGFSEMHFTVHVVDPDTMQKWVEQTKQSSLPLDEPTYNQLLTPSIGDQPRFFSHPTKDLFKQVISLYQNTYGTTHPHDMK